MDTTESTTDSIQRSRFGWVMLSITRIALGFYFLWAFLDKLLGLGFSTCRTTAEDGTFTVDSFCDNAWVNGGHVTEGYLVYGGNANSPFHDFFVDLGADRWTDWPFMIGLLGVGLALMLGIGTKVGAWAATAMLVMMYMTQMPVSTNPFLDEHLIYSLAVLAVVFVELEHQSIGLGGWWRRLVGPRSWLV